MTEFDQKSQIVQRDQYNAGGNITIHIPKVAWTPPVMLPPRAQSFVGRDEDLAWLLQQLRSEAGMTLALCGPGGMGKTALAAEALYLLVAQEDWSIRFPGGIFYHSFYIYPSLAVAFEELARLFEEEPGADPRRAAIRALSRRCTLLVFDGVEVLDDSLPLLELGGKNVILLLSRRQSDAPDLAHRRNLDLLSQEQGITLLQRLAGPRAADRQCVEQLVKHIGGYPLALQIIGSYLTSRQEEVADYLQWFKDEGLTSIDHGKHQSQSIPVLLQRTYNSLTFSEQHLFAIIGLLAPAPFPLELIQGVMALSERATQQALSSLVNLSVLRRPSLDYEVSHPLVYTFAKERLLPQMNSAPSLSLGPIWQERLLATLETHFDQSDRYDRTAFALWQPHVIPLVSAELLTAEQSINAAHLFHIVGLTAFTQGKDAEAEPLLKRALAIHEQLLGTTHLGTAASLNSLAILYQGQGRYVEAEPLLKCALTIHEQLSKTTHPNTAQILNNLGTLYQDQGKYTEAEQLLKRALTIREQILEPNDPDIAQSLNSLATFYQSQDKYIEAEPLLKRALAIHEQMLGVTDPETARSINNLAGLYETQNKYAEAESLYLRVQTIQEQVLGPTHPETAQTLNNLAYLYHNQGKYVEAEQLYLQALAIREQVSGPTHPETAQTLNNLAVLYQDQGKYIEAETLCERALIIREQQLGPTHPETALTLSNLALLYQNQKQDNKAEPLLERALTIFEQRLGITHHNTIQAFCGLAALYHDQCKYSKAELLYQRILTIFEQQLETTNPVTAQTLTSLVALYRGQGEYAKAETLCERVLAIFEQQLGPTHPTTIQTLSNLAVLYQDQGKYAEAEPLFKQILTTFERQQGLTHPNTAISLNNLAYIYHIQNEYTKAESLYLRALKIYEQHLGSEQLDVASNLHNLACLYLEQGKYTKAEKLYLRALTIKKQILGRNHPQTLSTQLLYDNTIQIQKEGAKIAISIERSTQTYHQRKALKKVKNRTARQSRKKNRNR